MVPLYDVAAEAQNDLFEIWRRIAEDSVDLADRIDLSCSFRSIRSSWCISQTSIASASWRCFAEGATSSAFCEKGFEQ
ncbi:MAG: hypothetical protein LAQ69_08540 [Acidobacteriia bacterium]|nr:hypothetical protein [Terriglobia bacterium]